MKDAQIISIGDELLIGDTINTNAAVIGSFLSDLGFSVKGVQVLPDSRKPVYHAVRHSLETYPLTITTGGLGPTHDDITKRVVAELFESSWVRDDSKSSATTLLVISSCVGPRPPVVIVNG